MSRSFTCRYCGCEITPEEPRTVRDETRTVDCPRCEARYHAEIKVLADTQEGVSRLKDWYVVVH